ncbi:hypothetical protein [Halomonas sp.]|uniref:hypothetical protein n=1 Tax=Halomonas sp. TaxID=1486246 RepID=UPI003F924A72
MFDQLKDLKWSQALLVIFGFLGLLAPGFLIIFLYKPELVIALDATKLILFSLALSGPVFAINLVFVRSTSKSEETMRGLVSSVVALLLTTTVLYVSLFLTYFLKLQFLSMVLLAGAIQLCIILAIITYDRVTAKDA